MDKKSSINETKQGMWNRIRNFLNNMTINNKFSLAIVVLSVLWLLSGFIFPSRHEQHVEQMRGGLEHMVRVIDSQAAPRMYRITYDAITSAKERVMLIAQARGLITSIPISSGALLKAGEVIINIEDRGAAANLKDAQAALVAAQLQYKAISALYKQKLAAKLDLDKATDGLRKAETNLRIAEVRNDNLQVVAPYNGYVDKILVKEGDVLVDVADRPRILVGEFANMEMITATVGVSARDAQKLRQAKNNTAQIVLNDGSQRAASLSFLAKVADASSNTFVVEFEADNKDLALLSGQNIKVIANLGERLAHKLPHYGLSIDDEGNPCIKAIDTAGKVQIYRDFELVDEDAEYIWVSKLPTKLHIIVVGQGYVKPGAQLDLSKVARQDVPL